MKRRVLHVWNTAGVASVIAKFSDRGFGTESAVMTRKAADRVGLTTYGTAYEEGATAFFLRAVLKSMKADVVHVHSLDRLVPWVKRLYRKPTIIHYHGTDIEGRWAEKKDRWSRADFVAVSTPNLLKGAPPAAVWMPNPVDTDYFRPVVAKRRPKTALSFRYGMDAEAEEAAERVGASLTLLERWSIRHDMMPATLSEFEYYVDLRKPPGKAQARSVGKAALEALACGCRVVDWTGNVSYGLPPEHEPGSVAARWNEVYLSLVKE